MRERTTRFVLLGILAEAGPSTGYEIRQWIEQAVGHFWMESFGQIYPELRLLLDEGLIERAGDAGSSRDRKRYRIAEAGRFALEAWLGQAPRPDWRRSELLLKLFFGRFADEDAARAWLVEAARQARAQLAYLDGAERQVIAEDARSPGFPFYLITLDAGRRAARARIDWAEQALRTLDLFRDRGAEALIAALAEEEQP